MDRWSWCDSGKVFATPSLEREMEICGPESRSILLDLVGSLYDATDRQALLEAFYRGLKKVLPAAPLMFFLPADSCSGRWSPEGCVSFPPGAAWAREWSLFYLRIDPLAIEAFRDPNSRAIRYCDLVDMADFHASRFYRDFFSRIPAGFALLLPLSCHGDRQGAVWILRSLESREFSDSDRETGDLLAYHLARAMLLVNLRSQPALCGQPGVLVYDGGKNLLYQNDRAQSILGTSDLRWCLDRTNDPHPVLQTEKGVFHCRVLPVRPQEVGFAASGEFPSGSRDPREGNVVILEPYRSTASLTRRLNHFDLSQRQSEVVLEVVRGHSNREIADKLGISLQTVKDHMHDIFRVLGVRSRTELMVMVFRGVDGENV